MATNEALFQYFLQFSKPPNQLGEKRISSGRENISNCRTAMVVYTHLHECRQGVRISQTAKCERKVIGNIPAATARP
jgi:hypothetical protein